MKILGNYKEDFSRLRKKVVKNIVGKLREDLYREKNMEVRG